MLTDSGEIDCTFYTMGFLSEYRELYVEELTLLKKIQSFGKMYSKADMERVDNVVMKLLYRVFSNLYSATMLTTTALKNKRIAFYQLPIGIVLRCCFIDCLFALYIQNLDKNRAYEDLDLRSVEYANSLLERREVYRDQVKSTGLKFDDGFIDHLWELSLEDNFLHLLAFDESIEGIELTKQSKTQLQKSGFSRSKSARINEQKDFLIKKAGVDQLAMKLYSYYKYFSQYEHFSENGHGDVMVSSKEDGNDNIHFPSCIRVLRSAVDEIMKGFKLNKC